MSVFEILMLACFGAAWPFSIYRMWKTKSSRGKSSFFLGIVIAGYAAGILHKIYYNYDPVVFLYAFNAAVVSFDLALTLHYRKNEMETGRCP